MNLRLFYPLTWLLLTYKDYCKVGAAITTVNFTGFGLLQNESLLEGDVLAECGTQWYKVCSINKKASILTEDVIRVCTDHYLYLYTHLQNNYDSIGLVTDNVSEIVNVYGQGCELKHDSCAPMFLRCPVLQPSVPTITFGELNVTHPVSTQDLKEGDTVYMTCSVYGGIPKPAFTWQTETMSNMETDRTKWYRNNAAINNTDETILFYQTIRVNLTRENNQDIYRCNVTLGGISQLTEKQLRVQFSPIISVLEIHADQAVFNVTVQCTVHSNPISITKLLKPNSQEIHHHQSLPNKKDPYNITYSFDIGTVTSSDFGNYTCLARNHIGGVDQEENKTTMLFIESAPIIYVIGHQTVQESASVTIQCTVHCYPVSDTKLLKPDGQILEHHGIIPNEEDPYNITYFFNMETVTSDFGKYTCLANNTVEGVNQQRNKTTMLFIEFAPVITVLDSLTTQESVTFNITCSVQSYPISDTKLLKPNGQEIGHREQLPNENEENPYNITYSFNIGVVTPSDWGEYTCVARNTIAGVDQERNKTTMLFIESAPIIYVIGHQTVQESASVTIQCTVHCYPVSDTKLLKPDGQILEHHGIIPNEEDPYNITYSFNIGAVTPTDWGNYTCVVRNMVAGEGQERNKTTMLFIEFAPIISIQESHTAQESVTILCTIHSNPVSTTKLLKPDGNGMQAFHKVQNPNEKVPHTITYTYFIGSVISSDAGIYKCWARNKIGGVDQERYNTTVLVVEFAPIIYITDTQLVTENASVTIQCTVYGCPVSDTKLLKPDGQILEHHGTPANGTDPYNITYNFNIDNVTAFDWGEYTCVARNTIAGVDQEQNKTTTLFIKFAPIISILDSQTTQESANVSIQCTVYSNPAPHTKLLKPDGQEIPVHHHVPESSELDPSNITYSFDVGVVTRSDAGKYKCWATNTIGAADHERHKTTMLVVEYAPTIRLPDIYTVAEHTSVKMRCAVKSFPLSTITWFNKKNQTLMTSYIENVVSGNVILEKVAVLDFPSVTRGDGGEYTCRAENVVKDQQQVMYAKTNLYVEAKTKNCTAIIRERKCTCNKRSTKIKPQQNLTTEVLMEMMEETKKQLTRDRTSLSSYTSTKVSATDNRPSSISLGFLGIVVITMAVAFIVSGDVMHCVIKFRMKFLKDNIPLMEKGQVEVSESNEDGGDTAISDEKPGTSCDHNNELKYDSMCSLNDKDSITSLSYMTSGTKEEEQAKENGTMTPTTATDIETESKLNDIEEIFVAPVDRKNRTSDAVNEPILRSDNAEKAESVTELPVGTDEDKRTELLPLAAVSSIVRDNNEGADISTKVKKEANKSAVQKSSDKFSPYKRGKVNPSSLKSNSKSKVNLFHSGIKASNVTEKPPTASKDMTSNTAKGKK